MHQVLWIAIAWAAGTAAILGCLMTLGSLLLWLVPTHAGRSRKAGGEAPESGNWQNQLKLTAFSIAIALVGLSLLIAVPFPQGQ
jgi:hypothetical protein